MLEVVLVLILVLTLAVVLMLVFVLLLMLVCVGGTGAGVGADAPCITWHCINQTLRHIELHCMTSHRAHCCITLHEIAADSQLLAAALPVRVFYQSTSSTPCCVYLAFPLTR